MPAYLSADFIAGLYSKYRNDMARVRESQKKLYDEIGFTRFEKYPPYRLLRRILMNCGIRIENPKMIMRPQLNDVEAEITYLLLREFKPKTVVEISPCGGWSTTWILNALKDNGTGRLFSYDIVDTSEKTIPQDLKEGRWKLIMGDVKENIDKLPPSIDYLFLDSDHSAEFARWYIQNLFPRLKPGTRVSVHDVFHGTAPSSFTGESRVILEYLEHNSIKYFTAAKSRERAVYDTLMEAKKKFGLSNDVQYAHGNSMIYFVSQ